MSRKTFAAGAEKRRRPFFAMRKIGRLDGAAFEGDAHAHVMCGKYVT